MPLKFEAQIFCNAVKDSDGQVVGDWSERLLSKSAAACSVILAAAG